METGVTEGFAFKFKVRSNQVITGSDLSIYFSLDDGTASLGLRAVETNAILVNTQETEFTVTMVSDANVDPTEDVKIVVTLIEHTDYDTNPDKESISVKVKDNDVPSASNPLVTISGPHYVAEGSTFNFILAASVAPTGDIDVNVEVTPTLGNFLAANQGGIRTVPISSGSRSGTLQIITTTEAAVNSDGRINAEVLDGNGYSIPTNDVNRNAEVVVYDALPVISLTAPDSISEFDGTFDITLTSNIAPLVNHPIIITTLEVDDTTGQNFDYFDSIPSSISD